MTTAYTRDAEHRLEALRKAQAEGVLTEEEGRELAKREADYQVFIDRSLERMVAMAAPPRPVSPTPSQSQWVGGRRRLYSRATAHSVLNLFATVLVLTIQSLPRDKPDGAADADKAGRNWSTSLHLVGYLPLLAVSLCCVVWPPRRSLLRILYVCGAALLLALLALCVLRRLLLLLGAITSSEESRVCSWLGMLDLMLVGGHYAVFRNIRE